MAKFIYIDNSNVFIEGQRVAAVRNGNRSSPSARKSRGMKRMEPEL